jgi:hypothetical protein
MMGALTAQARTDKVVKRINYHRQETQRLRQFMGYHKYRTSYSERKTKSDKYKKWVLALWEKRHAEAWKLWINPPHYNEWMCIHSYEGSWTDPNAPFWGGLQMDEEFQRTYGWFLYDKKGTADHWTPLEQMWVAERAFPTRGFWPWPNTARYCHLI